MGDWLERLMLERSASTRARIGGAVLLALAVACLVAVTCSGCGTVPRAARVTVAEYARAVNLADEAVARRIEAAGPEARAQVRGEIAARQVLGETPSETARLALERYDEIMRPLGTATIVVDSARRGALAFERALDAWDAHGNDQPFLTVAACAVAVLTQLGDALMAAEIEFPSSVSRVIEMVTAWGDQSCPEGGVW